LREGESEAEDELSRVRVKCDMEIGHGLWIVIDHGETGTSIIPDHRPSPHDPTGSLPASLTAKKSSTPSSALENKPYPGCRVFGRGRVWA